MPAPRGRRGLCHRTVGRDRASDQQATEGRVFHPDLRSGLRVSHSAAIDANPATCCPVSFGTATALHATLIARAKSLPAWMQLLHPFATLIAKSKLLVLPVYPAAWPQAKQHPIVQRFFQFCRYCMSLDVIQKVRYRYQ